LIELLYYCRLKRNLLVVRKEIAMTDDTPTLADRAAFEKVMADIRADHAMLRILAAAVSRPGNHSGDDAMSLAEAVLAHENVEARLFALPFVSPPPATVESTGGRARLRCQQYMSGNFNLPDANAAAALFVAALLALIASVLAFPFHIGLVSTVAAMAATRMAPRIVLG
jgi:hypothetical protein